MLKFTPPEGTARYAVAYSDQFRVYNDLGSAKNMYHSIYGNGTVVHILERVGGDWFVLFRVISGVERSALPWYKESTSWRTNGFTAKPMTRDEYAEWRLSVERERLGIDA